MSCGSRRSRVPGSRSWRPPSCDVGCADALQREPVADALVDDAAQLLGQRNARVAGRERRQLGEAFGDLARAGEQLVGRDDLVDGAPLLRSLGIELLAREDEVAAADGADRFLPEQVDA